MSPFSALPGTPWSEPQLFERFKTSKVVLPTVSFANVPQLALDLLVANLDCVKVGRLDSSYLYPFVSPPDPVVSGDILNAVIPGQEFQGVSTSLEVYYSDRYNVTLIQQRSPILPNYKTLFLKQVLLEFLTSIGKFQEVLILYSKSIVNPDTQAISADGLSYYCSQSYLQRLADLNLEEQHNQQPISEFKDKFFQTLVDLQQGVPDSRVFNKISSMVIYVYEGDNFQDAVYFYGKALEFLGITLAEKAMKKPYSWLGFYGDKPLPVTIQEGLYG